MFHIHALKDYLNLCNKTNECTCITCFNICACIVLQAGWHSRNSDWLRAGWSGDRILVGDEIFRTCPDRPWGPPSLLYNGYLVFPGGKERPGRDADPLTPFQCSGHERVELYLYSPVGRTAYTGQQCLYKGALYLYLLIVFKVHFTVLCF